jgi:peptidyl-prolyl cis-trans isomerase SurA
VTDEALLKQLNNDKTPDAVSIQNGRYEFSRFKDVSREALVKGKVSDAVKKDDGTWVAVKASEIYDTPVPKDLEDARGYAVAGYQDYLEKEWNAQLRAKYPVQLDEEVFKSMVQQ